MNLPLHGETQLATISSADVYGVLYVDILHICNVMHVPITAIPEKIYMYLSISSS